MPVLAALSSVKATALSAADAAPPRRPNVLFVVFDDLSARLGCSGDPVAKTPSLDRLAARGTVFRRAYCQQPICGPSRASFMSGRRPDSLGIWSMTSFLYDLHPDAVTMPQWFRQHGYTAMSIGKVLGGYGKEADFKKLSVPDRRTGGKTKDEFALPDGGGPQAVPDVMGYAISTDRWSYHEWRDFKSGRVVGQELYDQRDDPQETVNLAGTAVGTAEIPALQRHLAVLAPPDSR